MGYYKYGLLSVAVQEGMVQHSRSKMLLQGTFFLIEKLKLTVLRRLLMRCCVLHLEACAPGDSAGHQFPLGDFASRALDTLFYTLSAV